MRVVTLFVLVSLILGCAGPRIIERQFASDQILHMDEFRNIEDPGDLMKHVAYFKPGDRIPLKLKLESEWLNLAQEQVELVIKRKFFAKIQLPKDFSRADLEKILALGPERLSEMSAKEKMALFDGVTLLLSPDGKRWAPVQDKRALKAVMGLGGGTISAGMSMNTEEGIWLMVEMIIKSQNAP